MFVRLAFVICFLFCDHLFYWNGSFRINWWLNSKYWTNFFLLSAVMCNNAESVWTNGTSCCPCLCLGGSCPHNLLPSSDLEYQTKTPSTWTLEIGRYLFQPRRIPLHHWANSNVEIVHFIQKENTHQGSRWGWSNDLYLHLETNEVVATILLSYPVIST